MGAAIWSTMQDSVAPLGPNWTVPPDPVSYLASFPQSCPFCFDFKQIGCGFKQYLLRATLTCVFHLEILIVTFQNSQLKFSNKMKRLNKHESG